MRERGGGGGGGGEAGKEKWRRVEATKGKKGRSVEKTRVICSSFSLTPPVATRLSDSSECAAVGERAWKRPGGGGPSQMSSARERKLKGMGEFAGLCYGSRTSDGNDSGIMIERWRRPGSARVST